jgi:hypothetical protein
MLTTVRLEPEPHKIDSNPQHWILCFAFCYREDKYINLIQTSYFLEYKKNIIQFYFKNISKLSASCFSKKTGGKETNQMHEIKMI